MGKASDYCMVYRARTKTLQVLQVLRPCHWKTRIFGQATFYPKHCEIPKETQMDAAKTLATDLLQAIQRLQHNNVKHRGRHGEALRALAKFSR